LSYFYPFSPNHTPTSQLYTLSLHDALPILASDWLRDRGHTDVLGPSNPSLMDEIGILVDGFDYDPAIMMPYHKPYYDDLIKKAGFEKEIDMYAFRVNKEDVPMDRLFRAEMLIHRRYPTLNIRKIDLKNIDHEIKIVRHNFNKSWSDNWGFIPLTKEEFQDLASDLKLILDTDVAHIAEIDGEAVAFSIALPDLNQAFKNGD